MSKEDKNQISYKAYEDLEPFDPSVAERDLLRAVLAGAIQDVKKGGSDQRKATEFFLSPEDDYVFSFLSICDFLKIDPKKVLLVAGLEKSSSKKADKKEMENIFRELKLD